MSVSDFKFTAPDNLTYDGYVKSAKAVSDTRGIGGITIKYCDENGNETQLINVGTCTVKIDVAEGNEYLSATDLTDDSWTFTVNAKSVDGAAVGSFEKMIYNGSEQTSSAAVTIDGLTVTEAWSDVKNVRDKTTFTANGNFVGTISDTEPSMDRLSVVIQWNGTENLVYDGNKKTITAEITNICGNDAVNLTFDGDSLTQTEQGGYSAEVKAVDNDNYTIVGTCSCRKSTCKCNSCKGRDIGS